MKKFIKGDLLILGETCCNNLKYFSPKEFDRATYSETFLVIQQNEMVY